MTDEQTVAYGQDDQGDAVAALSERLVRGGWLEQSTGLAGDPPAERESPLGSMQAVLVPTSRAWQAAPTADLPLRRPVTVNVNP